MNQKVAEDAPSLERYDGGSYSAHAVHMVRSSMLAHLQLSQMADQKASLLMGATFVVFSIAIGQAATGSYRLSLIVLALSAFISASLAVAAVVPKILTKPPSGGRENLLFFGVFTHMSEDDYIDAIMRASETDGRVLSTMARDIYQNGMVLHTKKYRLLGYAYRTFQIGLTLTFLLFLFESRDTLQALFG
ncbi:MAG: DUF5706 domain-containing protein [Alteraurantiacibacter sp.]|nr:DUF5706 domain-containing protein [Alteraurantiacibacter sp.]